MNSFSEKAKQTIQRHKLMSCKVFELKIDKSALSEIKLNYLNRQFLEGKWLQNYILSTNDIFGFDTKINKVFVLNKDRELEEREIICLSSQRKQAIKEKLMNSVKALSAIKKKNLTLPRKQRKRIGKIKYTSNVKALSLNQFNYTYRFKDNKYLVLQGSKLKFKIEGLKQIPKDAEITCSTLCHRHKDFYLKITCFVPKETIEYKENNVGIDFGCITTLTLSNGEKKNLKIKENLRLRRTSRRLKKRNKGSQNYIKQKDIVNKEYHKLTNRKKDKKNEIVHDITTTFKIVIVQDESITAWHSGTHGKAVQNSLMGGIMRDLERKSHTFIKIDKFFPSSQLCYKCGHKQKMEEEQRKYICPVCGYKEDRDVNAALNIQREGLRMLESGEAASSDKCKIPKEIKIPAERREFQITPVEREPLLVSQSDNEQVLSLKQEAPTFRWG